MLSKAISIVAQAFENKKDKGGKPYILHCLRVMNDVDQNDEELMTISAMHDLVEDCPEWTMARLRASGLFSERVLKGIEVLTHKKEVPYMDYIKLIALNEDTRLVKLSDLKDNSNICRIKGLRKKDFDRLEKYHTAYMYLSK